MDLFLKVMSMLFNGLSRFFIAYLPRSKCLLISWLQSPSAVILEPKKIKSATVSIFYAPVCHEGMGAPDERRQSPFGLPQWARRDGPEAAGPLCPQLSGGTPSAFSVFPVWYPWLSRGPFFFQRFF